MEQLLQRPEQPASMAGGGGHVRLRSRLTPALPLHHPTWRPLFLLLWARGSGWLRNSRDGGADTRSQRWNDRPQGLLRAFLARGYGGCYYERSLHKRRRKHLERMATHRLEHRAEAPDPSWDVRKPNVRVPVRYEREGAAGQLCAP